MVTIIEHYDYNVGWENTKPGWHECTVCIKHVDKIDKINEIIKWLEINIGKYERHCRWGITDDDIISFKFRYERDYIMFTLRWS
jgi:hypothetical protein